jgi:uncharacterized protein YjiS (DUF1127 family)
MRLLIALCARLAAKPRRTDRAALAQLRMLDDHLLRDIGFERDRVPFRASRSGPAAPGAR